MDQVIAELRDSPVFLWNVLSFLVGLWAGHRFAIGRDDRNRRAFAFAEVRRHIAASVGPIYISPAQAEILLTECRPTRRQRLRKSIERCHQAADGYYTGKDSWGQPMPTPESEASMKAASESLLRELRRI